MSIKIHIAIVSVILIFQFFVSDIFSKLYLPFIKHNLKDSEGNYQLYNRGEYSPLSAESPRQYELAEIRQSGLVLTETFYLKNGNRTIVTYVDGKWESTETSFLSAKAFSVLPLIGFGLVMFVILRRSFRTGAITTWDLSKYPFDEFEKIILLYGVPIFLSGIFFGFLGRA